MHQLLCTQTARARLRLPEIDMRGKKIHLIGIGGCGMRGAAGLLLQCGAVVSGSDRGKFDGFDELTEAGARIHVGQHPDNIPADVDCVVYSAAVPDANPELQAARASSEENPACSTIKYAQLLGSLMHLRSGVAIAGTHGKSTTSAMTAHLFRTAGLDPSFVIGANVEQLGGGSGVGMGEHFIVEACEFDRSFLHLEPKYAAILNIEADHLDCYRDLNDIVDAFSEFAAQVDPDGLIVTPQDDVYAAAAVANASARVETIGFDNRSTWEARNLSEENGRLREEGSRQTFDVLFEGVELFSASLSLCGQHNVSNALTAIALAWNAGATREALSEGIASFTGVDRRLTLVGSENGITVLDDYAHHPTEISVTLNAIRLRYRPSRLWVVFQPHQHSRTRILMDAFAKCFSAADEVIIPRIYRSRDSQNDVDTTSAAMLVDRIEKNGVKVRHMADMDSIADAIQHEWASGDVVVTMGAGDIWKLANELAGRIRRSGH